MTNSNPKCIKCSKEQGSPNNCICNDEQRCARCKGCSWCINNSMNGRCVPNSKYNRRNCPYSFSKIPDDKKWREPEYSDEEVRVTTHVPTFMNLSIYKIIFIAVVLILLIILLITFLFDKKPNVDSGNKSLNIPRNFNRGNGRNKLNF